MACQMLIFIFFHCNVVYFGIFWHLALIIGGQNIFWPLTLNIDGPYVMLQIMKDCDLS